MQVEWTLTDDAIVYKGVTYPLTEMTTVKKTCDPHGNLTNGVLQINLNSGKVLTVAYPSKQAKEGNEAYEYLKNNLGSKEVKERRDKENEGIVYDLTGVRGRTMKVFEDRCVIKTEATLGTLLAGNASDGAKTIYYADCIGVQFKESGVQIGYLQLETASGLMNNKTNNFFNENSFTFDASTLSNEKMNEVADYVRSRVAAAKNAKNAPVVQQASQADEILKFKSLLDAGIITQEEFNEKKKQLLGL